MKSQRMDFTIDKLPRFSRRERDYYKLLNFEPPTVANVLTVEDLVNRYNASKVQDPMQQDLCFKLDRPKRFSRQERAAELKPIPTSKLIRDIEASYVVEQEKIPEGIAISAARVNVNLDSPPKFTRLDRESRLLIQDLPAEPPTGPIHHEHLDRPLTAAKPSALKPLDFSLIKPAKFTKKERMLNSPPHQPSNRSLCEQGIEFVSSIYSDVPERLQLGKKHVRVGPQTPRTYLEGQSEEFLEFVRSRTYSPPHLSPTRLPQEYQLGTPDKLSQQRPKTTQNRPRVGNHSTSKPRQVHSRHGNNTRKDRSLATTNCDSFDDPINDRPSTCP